MIRIAICCGGGFSSSTLVSHMQKTIEKEGLQEKAVFEFIPFVHLKERQKEVDIAMLCPHLEWAAKQHVAEFQIPLYVIPPKLYGLMPAEDFIEDAEDILKLWQEHPCNVMHFPDEPRPLAITRMVSHRRMLRGEKADLNHILGK
jgi:PTS system cellobiose-specific IIB component